MSAIGERLADVHDCAAAGCEGAVRRAHEEAVAQGMPAFIEPNGDALHDAAVNAGYRALARVLARAAAPGAAELSHDTEARVQ